MLGDISGEVVQAARDLAVAGVCYMSFKITRDAARLRGPVPAGLRGLAWSLGLALIAAALLGSPSCDGGDPMFGYCDSAGEGYAPTLGARAARFVYFFLLLAIPSLIGASDDKARLREAGRKASSL